MSRVLGPIQSRGACRVVDSRQRGECNRSATQVCVIDEFLLRTGSDRRCADTCNCLQGRSLEHALKTDSSLAAALLKAQWTRQPTATIQPPRHCARVEKGRDTMLKRLGLCAAALLFAIGTATNAHAALVTFTTTGTFGSSGTSVFTGSPGVTISFAGTASKVTAPSSVTF